MNNDFVDIKKNFPLLNNGLVYLDNAATTQKPFRVINKLKEFYEVNNANPGRGVYDLSVKASSIFSESRKVVANFINAEVSEIFFVKNASEGFNQLANSISLKQGENVVCSIMEHHSNFVPWLELCKRSNAEFKVSKLDVENSVLDLVDDKTKIVTFTLMSNVSGYIVKAKSLIEKIKLKNKDCLVIVDAAQAIAHKVIDVKDLNCDFLVFSGHKVYGPLGVGVVFGKSFLLQNLRPSFFGGGMVSDFKNGEFVFADAPEKFEYGSLDVASISGLNEALLFVSDIKNKFDLEKELLVFALSELRKLNFVKIIGHNSDSFGPIVSFVVEGVHPHDLASIADSFNVCIRAGHHCAKPYINALGLDAVVRISLSFYNSKEDVLKLVDAVKKAKVIFNG